MILWNESVSIVQFKKVEHGGAGDRESNSLHWQLKQKPSKEKHAASYMKDSLEICLITIASWYSISSYREQRGPVSCPKPFDLKN